MKWVPITAGWYKARMTTTYRRTSRCECEELEDALATAGLAFTV